MVLVINVWGLWDGPWTYKIDPIKTAKWSNPFICYEGEKIERLKEAVPIILINQNKNVERSLCGYCQERTNSGSGPSCSPLRKFMGSGWSGEFMWRAPVRLGLRGTGHDGWMDWALAEKRTGVGGQSFMSSALYVLLLFSALWTLSLCGTRHFHLVNEQKTWTEAQSYCRANFTDLATTESQQEMDAVKAALNGAGGYFWIGLSQTVEQNIINKTWGDALRYCRENHVDLVSVHTEEVQHWVEVITKNASTANVWVGLRHTCAQRIWFWVSGSTICYQNWAPGNGTGVEDCSGGERTGAVQSGSKQWVSLPETQTLNFICSVE
ncbi:hypothetical protein NFI96_031364, partial [Prochilodus magdalenae]